LAPPPAIDTHYVYKVVLFLVVPRPTHSFFEIFSPPIYKNLLSYPRAYNTPLYISKFINISSTTRNTKDTAVERYKQITELKHPATLEEHIDLALEHLKSDSYTDHIKTKTG